MRLVRAAAATALLLAVVPGTTSTSAAQCLVDLEQRNAWHAIPDTTGPVAMDDAAPCQLLQVRPDLSVVASNDGGATWARRGAAPVAARALVSEGLAPDSTLLLPATGTGLWASSDRGVTWNAATGLSGTVRSVAADERDSATVFAVASAANPLPVAPPAALPVGAGVSAYVSHDGGRSFSPLAGSAGLAASSIASDPAVPGRLWLGVDGAGGGLFSSDNNGQAFLRRAGGAVRAIATSRLAGGGSQVVAATSDGFLVSRDGGSTVTPRSTGTSITDLQLEWDHPSAMMAVTAAGVRRSADAGASTKEQAAGLPGGCAATNLSRDRSVPSFFLLRCTDGSAWRYRSDGTDLVDTDRPDAPPQLVAPPYLGTPTPMRELRRIPVAHRDGGTSGSLAFDGRLLYYTDPKAPGVIHRENAQTGRDAGDLPIDWPKALYQVAYDANRHRLYGQDFNGRVVGVDLRTGHATKMFRSPAYAPSADEDEREETDGARLAGTMTFDAATDHLIFALDSSTDFTETDLAGRVVGGCALSQIPTLITVSGTVISASFAALSASGDGRLYAELEDDATVMRIDRSCRILAMFEHEYFSEAPNENDALACDTNSFETPAIWLRDAQAGRLVAYEVPAGYCALPTRLTVTSPESVVTGGSGTVCATLSRTATGERLGGLPVDLLVAGRGIGSPVTGPDGRACADYRPLPDDAGRQAAAAHSAKQPVVGAFLGTSAYRPSSAGRSVVVSSVPLPPAPPAAKPVAPLPVVHAAAPLVAVPVVPPAQPPPPPPNLPQSQPIAQSHPGAQPGAQGAPGGAMAPEEEAETAAQGADVAEFRAREDPSLVWPAAAVPLAAGLILGVAVSRRRRASRVVGQWA